MFFASGTYLMERRKDRTEDIVGHILRLTRRANLMLDAYGDIMNQLDAYQRYVELSRYHRAKLRHGFVVIEGSLRRHAKARSPSNFRRTGKVISLFSSGPILGREKR